MERFPSRVYTTLKQWNNTVYIIPITCKIVNLCETREHRYFSTIIQQYIGNKTVYRTYT